MNTPNDGLCCTDHETVEMKLRERKSCKNCAEIIWMFAKQCRSPAFMALFAFPAQSTAERSVRWFWLCEAKTTSG